VPGSRINHWDLRLPFLEFRIFSRLCFCFRNPSSSQLLDIGLTCLHAYMLTSGSALEQGRKYDQRDDGGENYHGSAFRSSLIPRKLMRSVSDGSPARKSPAEVAEARLLVCLITAGHSGCLGKCAPAQILAILERCLQLRSSHPCRAYVIHSRSRPQPPHPQSGRTIARPNPSPTQYSVACQLRINPQVQHKRERVRP